MLKRETIGVISLLKELDLTDGFALQEHSYSAALQYRSKEILERLCFERFLLKYECLKTGAESMSKCASFPISSFPVLAMN